MAASAAVAEIKPSMTTAICLYAAPRKKPVMAAMSNPPTLGEHIERVVRIGAY